MTSAFSKKILSNLKPDVPPGGKVRGKKIHLRFFKQNSTKVILQTKLHRVFFYTKLKSLTIPGEVTVIENAANRKHLNGLGRKQN